MGPQVGEHKPVHLWFVYILLRSLWTCISGVSGVLRGQDVYLGKNWVLQRANSSQHRRRQEG